MRAALKTLAGQQANLDIIKDEDDKPTGSAVDDEDHVSVADFGFQALKYAIIVCYWTGEGFPKKVPCIRVIVGKLDVRTTFLI